MKEENQMFGIILEDVSTRVKTSSNVYMKRFGMCFNRLIMANSRQHITAYETWLKPSHASYTLDR